MCVFFYVFAVDEVCLKSMLHKLRGCAAHIKQVQLNAYIYMAPQLGDDSFAESTLYR